MTFTVNRVENGWQVEVWRGREARRWYVFAGLEDCYVFLGELMREAG